MSSTPLLIYWTFHNKIINIGTLFFYLKEKNTSYTILYKYKRIWVTQFELLCLKKCLHIMFNYIGYIRKIQNFFILLPFMTFQNRPFSKLNSVFRFKMSDLKFVYDIKKNYLSNSAENINDQTCRGIFNIYVKICLYLWNFQNYYSNWPRSSVAYLWGQIWDTIDRPTSIIFFSFGYDVMTLWCTRVFIVL